jgi:large subunit ribosomal protein L4
MTVLNIKDFVQDSWLVADKGEQAVKDSVVAFMAGLRSGTACTKTKGKVAGSGAKPWRQKGTGRARPGIRRSPLWRGGGVTFGPLPRSYEKKVNAKVQKLALKRTFADRLAEDEVILVDEIPSMLDEKKAPKTAKMKAFLKEVNAGEHALVVDADVACEVELASQNLPTVLALDAAYVNAYLLMYFRKIVITKAGLEALGARLG